MDLRGQGLYGLLCVAVWVLQGSACCVSCAELGLLASGGVSVVMFDSVRTDMVLNNLMSAGICVLLNHAACFLCLRANYFLY